MDNQEFEKQMKKILKWLDDKINSEFSINKDILERALELIASVNNHILLSGINTSLEYDKIYKLINKEAHQLKMDAKAFHENMLLSTSSAENFGASNENMLLPTSSTGDVSTTIRRKKSEPLARLKIFSSEEMDLVPEHTGPISIDETDKQLPSILTKREREEEEAEDKQASKARRTDEGENRVYFSSEEDSEELVSIADQNVPMDISNNEEYVNNNSNSYDSSDASIMHSSSKDSSDGGKILKVFKDHLCREYLKEFPVKDVEAFKRDLSEGIKKIQIKYKISNDKNWYKETLDEFAGKLLQKYEGGRNKPTYHKNIYKKFIDAAKNYKFGEDKELDAISAPSNNYEANESNEVYENNDPIYKFDVTNALESWISEYKIMLNKILKTSNLKGTQKAETLKKEYNENAEILRSNYPYNIMDLRSEEQYEAMREEIKYNFKVYVGGLLKKNDVKLNKNLSTKEADHSISYNRLMKFSEEDYSFECLEKYREEMKFNAQAEEIIENKWQKYLNKNPEKTEVELEKAKESFEKGKKYAQYLIDEAIKNGINEGSLDLFRKNLADNEKREEFHNKNNISSNDESLEEENSTSNSGENVNSEQEQTSGSGSSSSNVNHGSSQLADVPVTQGDTKERKIVENKEKKDGQIDLVQLKHFEFFDLLPEFIKDNLKYVFKSTKELMEYGKNSYESVVKIDWSKIKSEEVDKKSPMEGRVESVDPSYKSEDNIQIKETSSYEWFQYIVEKASSVDLQEYIKNAAYSNMIMSGNSGVDFAANLDRDLIKYLSIDFS